MDQIAIRVAIRHVGDARREAAEGLPEDDHIADGAGRRLSHDFRFVARTAPDILDGMKHLVHRAARAGLKFRGRRVGMEGVLNAVILDYLAKPEAERLAILRANLPRFEAVMADDPGPSGNAAPGPGTAQGDSPSRGPYPCRCSARSST
jgi:hypothetical protein